MRPVQKYARSYRRFTWHNRKVHGAAVLSVRRQTRKNQCAYYSVIAAFESQLRLHLRFAGSLSIKYLKSKHDRIIGLDAELKKFGRIERLMRMLMKIGVPSEELYLMLLQGEQIPCPMHKISGYTTYDVSQPMQIRQALEKHLKKGPMVAVFYISANYFDCMKHSSVYKFTGLNYVEEGVIVSHAVCVVSFGLEENVPFLLFRTEDMRWPEYGRVEIQSVIELYGINI